MTDISGHPFCMIPIPDDIYEPVSYTHLLMVAITMLPFSEGMSTPWPVTMAGTALATLPVIVIFIVLQAFMKDGLTLGAVKG